MIELYVYNLTLGYKQKCKFNKVTKAIEYALFIKDQYNALLEWYCEFEEDNERLWEEVG